MLIRLNRWTGELGWDGPLPAELDSAQTLALVFGSPRADLIRQPLAMVRDALKHSCIAGCSTAGEILGESVSDDSLVVATVRFERSWSRHVDVAVHRPDQSEAAGRTLGIRLAAPELRAVLVFSDGLHVNGSALVRGLLDALPPGVTVSGGLAADGASFQSTWVLCGGRPEPGRIGAVGLYGPIAVTTGSRGGWDPFGPERRVTRADGNVLYELDGRPALALYKEYLGDLASGLPASALLFPLAVRLGGDGAEPVVRTVLGVDEATQSMTFAGDVPAGCLARLMRSNHDRLIRGAHDAAAGARASMARDAPVLALAVSCVGRRLVLKQRVEEETEATLEAMPPGSAQVGFYSYGEISPSGFAACGLHNQTMTLTTIGEESA
jgi:hypothetical protein